MNSDNGHIYDLTKKEILNVKGKLILWKVGERVEVKECLFEVVEIECIPVDKIVLKGLAKTPYFGERLSEVEEEVEEEFNDNSTMSEGLRGFLNKKH